MWKTFLKICVILSVFTELIVAKRNFANHKMRSLAAFDDGRSLSCCFIDIWCASACLTGDSRTYRNTRNHKNYNFLSKGLKHHKEQQRHKIRHNRRHQKWQHRNKETHRHHKTQKELKCNISIDERIVGFKGRHKLKQYMAKKKKSRWGAKMWVLADSKTGYTYKVDVYKGKSDGVRHVNGQGYKTVMELMQGHLYKGHHLTIDSFFTSPALVHDLARRGTHVTGSAVASRKGMPLSFKRCRLPKGTMTARLQGPVLAILWSDRKQVYILTTTGNARMIRTRNASGKRVKIPSAIRRYNYLMGGVDKGDQLLAAYEPIFRSVKLWKKILFNLLSTAAVNAYILYRNSYLVARKMGHYQFHKKLCIQLVGNYRGGSAARTDPQPVGVIPKRLTERHFPDKIPGGKRKKCVVCSTRSRREGVYKKTRIQTWCPACKVGLCANAACFRIYHTVLSFEE